MPDSEMITKIPTDILTRYGDEFTPIFIAYGCVLLEKFTGERYVYRVASLETGGMAYLCHRRKRLCKAEHESFAERIRGCDIADLGRIEIDASIGKKCNYKKLTDIQDIIFNRLMPEHGYTVREKQTELAGHILETLNRRIISLSEAEVGTGKTHAYLIAAALAKRGRINNFWLGGKYPDLPYISPMPVVISTSSIALQNAITRDYIPEISNILMKHGIIKTPLSCVIRKGKEHYVCQRRLHNYHHSTDAGTRQLLAPLYRKKSHIDLDEMDQLTPYTKRKISVPRRCDRKCPHYYDCRYRQYYKHIGSNGHDFQICNHNYLLADIMKRARGYKPLLPHYQAIIIDEAHKFLEAARQMYGTELCEQEIVQLAKDIDGLTFIQQQKSNDVQVLTAKLSAQNKVLFKRLCGKIPKSCDTETERFKTEIDDAAERIVEAMIYFSDKLSAVLKRKAVLTKYEGRHARILWQLSDIRDRIMDFEFHDNLIYWLESPNKNPQLMAIPKRLSEILHQDLWSNGIPIILTSGTLSAGGDFTHTKKALGLDLMRANALVETNKPSPFNHKDNVLLYISENMPFPNNKDKLYISAIANEVERLIHATCGHTAVLFTSYKAMELVFKLLKDKDAGFPLIRFDKGKATAIEQFKRSGNGVLFACGSFWEGVDLPGDILSSLIIVKLPFAVPDPVSDYERSLYPDMKTYKDNVIVPEMLIKLKQGFGRLLRSETDTGVVSILDSRVSTCGAYRSRMLKALPDCRVTADIGDVRAFIRQKKDETYFIKDKAACNLYVTSGLSNERGISNE